MVLLKPVIVSWWGWIPTNCWLVWFRCGSKTEAGALPKYSTRMGVLTSRPARSATVVRLQTRRVKGLGHEHSHIVHHCDGHGEHRRIDKMKRILATGERGRLTTKRCNRLYAMIYLEYPSIYYSQLILPLKSLCLRLSSLRGLASASRCHAVIVIA